MSDESKQFVGPKDNADKTPVAPPLDNPVINEAITGDIFDKLMSGVQDASISKAVEDTKKQAELSAKPAEVKEPEVLPDPPKDKPVDDKPEDKLADNKSATVDDKFIQMPEKRDYSGIDEALVPVFKKMGNEFFNNLAPIAKANVELKKTIEATKQETERLKKNAMPESYYSHPRGYTLTPDFEVAANTAIKAEQIVNHWKTQLEKIEEGESTYRELHINPQNGEFYLSGEVKADKESTEKLRKIVSGSEQQLAGVKNNLVSLASKHNEKYQQAVDAITDFENTSFAYMNGENKEKLDPIITDALNKIVPPILQDSPLARPLVKAIFTIQQLGEQLKAAKVAPEVKPEDKAKKNPTLSNMSGGATSNEPKVASIQELEEVLGRTW